MTTYQEWKIKQMRMVREAFRECAERERLALVFKASQQAESDPPVKSDCAKANTKHTSGFSK